MSIMFPSLTQCGHARFAKKDFGTTTHHVSVSQYIFQLIVPQKLGISDTFSQKMLRNFQTIDTSIKSAQRNVNDNAASLIT